MGRRPGSKVRLFSLSFSVYVRVYIFYHFRSFSLALGCFPCYVLSLRPCMCKRRLFYAPFPACSLTHTLQRVLICYTLQHVHRHTHTHTLSCISLDCKVHYFVLPPPLSDFSDLASLFSCVCAYVCGWVAKREQKMEQEEEEEEEEKVLLRQWRRWRGRGWKRRR